MARAFFPEASSVSEKVDDRRGSWVRDADGRALGSVLTTSPDADDLIGYSGPSNLLIALEPDGRVRGVSLLSSADTAAHVEEVRRADFFWKSFVGWSPASEPSRTIDAVSGSTLTSLAMAEAVERRLSGSAISRRFPEPLTLDEVRAVFAAAARLQSNVPRPGWTTVRDDQNRTLGFVIRTSPAGDNVRGYRGPTESLVAIAADEQTVLGVRLRRSYDTPEYVDRVREDDDFLGMLAGRSIDDWARLDFAAAGIEGVSGATQTSFGVAEGLRRRFRAEIEARDATTQASRRTWHNAGLLLVVLGALVITYSPLHTSRFLRFVWQCVLIAGFGICLGDLLSLALLAGWSRHGVPWQTAPSWVLLAVVALVAPWGTRRNLYCQHLCPHGAAQEWLTSLHRWFHKTTRSVSKGGLSGRATKSAEHSASRTLRVTSSTRWFVRVPTILLAIAWMVALTMPQFDLAQLEPFDAWVLPLTALSSTLVFVVGIAASWFIPQAYCRFGCPTGALLKFVRSGGSYDRIGRRDVAAVALLILGAGWIAVRSGGSNAGAPNDTSRRTSANKVTMTELRGTAFGTTWSIKLRGDWPGSESVRDRVASELSRIETTLSHWKPDSATAQFNATETTLPMELPAELIALVARGQELSRATNGLFDMTVAPLVQAWGYGPGERREVPPTDAEIQELLQRTGWQKLEVDREANTLRKQHPALQLDLGALLQGYAVDQIATLLDSLAPQDSPEYLIEVGGELRARGAWQVAIENPSQPTQPLLTMTLTDAALATSGAYRSRRIIGHADAHHLISPQTGRPVTATLRLCSVVSPTCVEADGWATALFLSDLSTAMRIASEHKLRVWLLDEAGELHTVP
jgi:thiamine biosynthesis lipoprotein ApbE/Na+-translocating ferredoxin:NAD+ oxidoreductase RnfG subunit